MLNVLVVAVGSNMPDWVDRAWIEYSKRLRNTVKIELREPNAEGRRRFSGQLTDVAEDAVTVDVDGRHWSLPVEDIAVARLAPQLKV